MSFKSQVLGYRKLSNEPDALFDVIKEHNSDETSFDQGDSLKIFETSKQKTWLVATPQRLYCILDDVRRAGPQLKWAMTGPELINPSIQVHPESGRPMVDITDKHKQWLFSPELFIDKSIKESIEELVNITAPQPVTISVSES